VRGRYIAGERNGVRARAGIRKHGAERRVRSAREAPNEGHRRNAALPDEALARPAGSLFAAAEALVAEAGFVVVACALVAAASAVVASIARRHCAVECYQAD
jgi:hypothetical protein